MCGAQWYRIRHEYNEGWAGAIFSQFQPIVHGTIKENCRVSNSRCIFLPKHSVLPLFQCGVLGLAGMSVMYDSQQDYIVKLLSNVSLLFLPRESYI